MGEAVDVIAGQSIGESQTGWAYRAAPRPLGLSLFSEAGHLGGPPLKMVAFLEVCLL